MCASLLPQVHKFLLPQVCEFVAAATQVSV